MTITVILFKLFLFKKLGANPIVDDDGDQSQQTLH